MDQALEGMLVNKFIPAATVLGSSRALAAAFKEATMTNMCVSWGGQSGPRSGQPRLKGHARGAPERSKLRP